VTLPAAIRIAVGVLCLGAAAPAQIRFTEAIVDPQNLSNPWGKAVGDFNGDGFPDLAAATAYNAPIYWYAYPGWTRYVLSPRNGGDDLLTADMDGDGDADVVSNGYAILWHQNPGGSGGDPGQPWAIHNIWTGGRSHDLCAADVNNDGKTDILIRLEHGPTKLFLQSGPDQFTRVDINAPNGEGSALADMNGDGKPDIVENGYWLEQPANPASPDWPRHNFAAWPTTETAVAVADINKDGRPDVFLASSYAVQRLSWFEAPADPAAAWTEHAVASPVGYVHRFHLADIDGDGDKDVIFAEQHQCPAPGPRVGVFLNQDGRGGSWTLQVISTIGSHNIAIGDIGKDGDLDVFGINWRGDTRPRLWTNDGAVPAPGNPPPDTAKPPPPDTVKPLPPDTVKPPNPPPDTSHPGPGTPPDSTDPDTSSPGNDPPPYGTWSDSIEAEYTRLSGPIFGNDAPGFSGTGFIDYQGQINDYLEWTVPVRIAGEYVLEFRYALGDTRSRPLEISLNDKVVQPRLDFPGTGGWSKWATVKMVITLPAGEAKIKAKAIGLSGANFDWLKLTPY
jgi:hypothetical protein